MGMISLNHVDFIQTKNHSKRFGAITKKISRSDEMEPLKAIEMLKECATAAFDETIEVHARLNLNPVYNDQQLRTTVVLPKGTGKRVRVAVITQGENIAEANSADADLVGSEELVERIAGGFLDFDKLVATPDMMPKIAKLGRLLGPKGLMPNPKTGTVTTTIAAAIRDLKAGRVELRTDKTGIVHVAIGKSKFSCHELLENLKAVVACIQSNKPSGAKGVLWKSLFVSSSMGPGIRLDIGKARDL